MKRYIEIDFFRGLLLVIMMIDHVGCPVIRSVTYQSLGYITAAEGFVFIAGLIAGMMLRKNPSRGLIQFSLKMAFKRMLHIYIYYILSYMSILAFAVLFPTLTKNWNQFAPLFYSNIGTALKLGPLLLYLPIYFDILPVFIFFSFITPFIFRLFSKGKEKVVLILSGLIWLLAQFGLSKFLVYRTFDISGLNFGYFNIFGWQALYIAGLFVGVFYPRLKLNKKLINNNVLWACLVVMLFFFLYRHEFIQFKIYFIGYLSHVPNLGFFRLINFLALAYVLIFFARGFLRVFKFKFLVFLGQHSLQVFIFNIFIVYFLKIVRYQIKGFGIWRDVLFTIVGVLILPIPAYLHYRYQKRKGILKM